MARKGRAKLTLEPREISGRKSDLNRLRREGKVAASIFAHGEPQALQISEKELGSFLHDHGLGAVIDVEVEGKTTPAVIREIDRHILRGNVLQLGLQRISMRETLKVNLPIHFVGEEELQKRELVLERQITELEVTARADQLPEYLEVDVSHLEAHESFRIGDLKLPEGLETSRDPELPLASVTLPAAAFAEEEVEAEAVAADEVLRVGEEESAGDGESGSS